MKVKKFRKLAAVDFLHWEDCAAICSSNSSSLLALWLD